MNRHIRTILLLPGTVLVVVPAILLITTHSLRVGWSLGLPLSLLPTVGGVALIGVGLWLMTTTIRLFMRFGEGTLAPWDETQKLVVRGPYRYVRNPMHLGVFLVLYGEGLLCGSIPLLIFATAAVAVHLFYFPLSEEPGLERRFGEAYRVYKRNVPRWIPRRTPWEPPDDASDQGRG